MPLKTAGTERLGKLYPREVIFKVAHHAVDDVYLSYEHYASQDHAEVHRTELMLANPTERYSVVEYRRVG